MSWLDRAISWVSPKWALSRARSAAMARHFEAASSGRRTDNRHRVNSDANNAASGAALSVLRAQARDMVRNNPWADNALRAITGNTVGWGIRPLASGRGARRANDLWKLWAESTQCDSAGRQTFYGLQALAMRTIAESGEVLIRRRIRRPEDGLAIPMQLQILEPDYLDTNKDSIKGFAGDIIQIIQGVEFDQLGRRVAYWLFDQHPGGRSMLTAASRRIPADQVLHVFDQDRAGQVRGPSWFSSVDIRLRDFDEFEDATLMKQKIAACMAAFVTDLDGTGSALGQPGMDGSQATDTFEPGMIIPLPSGKQVTIANPPSSTDYKEFSSTALRGIAAGLGITYEDMTGDYSQVNYSSARMARLAHQRNLHHWRWNMLVPLFCSPVWTWAMDLLILAGEDIETAPAQWIAPPMPILEPDKEGLAYQRLLRIGAITWPQMISELGEDPKAQLAAIAEFNSEADRLGIVLDSDPRKMSAGGQVQAAAAPATLTDVSPALTDVATDPEPTDSTSPA